MGMILKAVLFDFVVIINDEPHEHLIDQILISENLRPNRGVLYVWVGVIAPVLVITHLKGSRVETQLLQLVKSKAQAYQHELGKVTLYPGLEDLIFRCVRDH